MKSSLPIPPMADTEVPKSTEVVPPVEPVPTAVEDPPAPTVTVAVVPAAIDE
jgi:hypothetical protein